MMASCARHFSKLLIVLAISLHYFSGAAPAEVAKQEGDSSQTVATPITDSKRKEFLAAMKAFKKEDVPELERKAEAGDREAQLMLGAIYQEGLAVEINFVTAVFWYRKAAEQGHPMAQNSMGLSYRDGRGVAQDRAEALRWMHKAAGQNYAQAQCNIGWAYYRGLGVPADANEAIKWYRTAMAQGYACAQVLLGIAFLEGKGVSQDPKQATELFRKAAEQGDAKGQLYLAISYDSGSGIKLDHAEAARWYRAAAEQKDLAAMFALAMSYHNGEGVPKSAEEAEKWFRSASDAGWAPATYYLGKMYADRKFQMSALTGTIAIQLFEKSAEQGYSLGALELSDIFSSRLLAGHLWVSKDDEKACRWLIVARELNNHDRWESVRPEDSAIVRKELLERLAKMEKKFKQGLSGCERSATEWIKAHQTKPNL